MTELRGGSQPTPLDNNYSIRAPGVLGEASVVRRQSIAGTTRAVTTALEGAALDRALSSQDMRDVATINVKVTGKVAAPAGAVLRAPGGEDALELEVPAPGEGEAVVVLAVDESGAITWNYPLTETNAIATSVTRGPGARVKFRIPRTPAISPPPGQQRTRSLFGTIGKKVFKVLLYPITDRLVGPLVDRFAENWETKNRPYRLRTVTAANYASPDAPSLAPDDAAWAQLATGRALFFVHGTFSSTHSGFAGLSPEDVQALADAYGGRLFAFDHFTLSHSPTRNATELLNRLPAGTPLDADIVCHSRGGLVSREIVERGGSNGLHDKLRIGKVVFVGAANAGTALAMPDHMTNMIDRFTTALDAMPDGPVSWLLEGLVTAVKVIGHGGLNSLDGLAAMNPGGPYLTALGTPAAGTATGTAVYHGIAANFEPKGTSFDRLALKSFAADQIMDRVFLNEPNDLVVPTKGVSTALGSLFPIATSSMLSLDTDSGVTHTTYFSNPRVREQLRTWLTG